jgi:transposase-like protein
MVPSWHTLLRGLAASTARCPRCGSGRVRVSQESYDSRFAAVMRLIPYRCRKCHQHFALSVRLPSPVMEEDAPGGAAERSSQDGISARGDGCPACRSSNVGPAARQPAGLLNRMLRRERYRCFDCDRRFMVWHRGDAFALLFAVFALVAALAASLVTQRSEELRRAETEKEPKEDTELAKEIDPFVR